MHQATQNHMDQYLKERWKQQRESLMTEYNMVCAHHKELLLLQVSLS